jgi:hypothetical protein
MPSLKSQPETDAAPTAPAAAAPKARPGAATGSAWTPPKAALPSTALPKLPASPPFVLLAHPQRWTVMAGKVIPLMGRTVLQPGVNNVTAIERAGVPPIVQWKQAVASREERGWIAISWDVDGPGTSYLIEVAPGVVVEKWTRTYPGSDRVDCDEAAYADWCRSLIARGYIAPPAVHILESMRDIARAELAKAAEQAPVSTSAKGEVKRIEALIAALDAELAEANGEAA